jgi:hypothetical protein
MRRFEFAIALLGIFLSGCAPMLIFPSSSNATLAPIETLAPTSTAVHVYRTGPASTSTIDLPPENILKYHPFDVAPGLPPNVKPTGVLLIWGDQPQLLHFESQVRVESLPGIDFPCLSTSPDGQWLAYCPLSDDSPTGQLLIVESADQQQKKKVPLKLDVLYYHSYQWLDNQQLIFPLVQKDDEKLRSMGVVNPFTGKQQELVTEYPGMTFSMPGPAGRMQFMYSSVVYDPSLRLVVYPQWGSPNYIILWDRQSKSALAKIEDDGEFSHYPLWSPDASQFAVAVFRDVGKNIIDEWFSASRDGQKVERLTHFGDYFADAEIGVAGNWSPDGQKLAFWLKTSTGPCSDTHLAILEMATRQVTNTCIPGALGDSPPLWSLDSRYIVVRNTMNDSLQTLLVDIEQGRAFDITKYGVPIGWLALP